LTNIDWLSDWPLWGPGGGGAMDTPLQRLTATARHFYGAYDHGI
jgi:hypothetical protein